MTTVPAAGDVWEHAGLYYEIERATLPGDVALAEQGLVAISHGAPNSKIHNMPWLAENGSLVERLAIRELIEASSFGTPGARKLRERGRRIVENRGKSSST